MLFLSINFINDDCWKYLVWVGKTFLICGRETLAPRFLGVRTYGNKQQL